MVGTTFLIIADFIATIRLAKSYNLNEIIHFNNFSQIFLEQIVISPLYREVRGNMKVGSRTFYTGQTNEKILFTVQNIES